MGPKPGTVQKRPLHDTITEGDATGVLLSNRAERVWIDTVDFSRIVEMYGNRSWSWVKAKHYVRLKPDASSEVPIARLVVGEGGRFIRYADGDRLNLRRANLSTQDAMMPVERKKRRLHAPSVKVRPPQVPAQAQNRSLSTKVAVPKQIVQAVASIKRSRVP